MKFTAALVLGVAGVAFAQPWTGKGIVAHEGKPVGKEVDYDGLTLYVSEPKHNIARKTAVVYITDVFGINLTENKLLSDSFARAGYATIAPDLFDGQPAPADLNDPNFDAGKFIAEHGPEVTDPKIEKAIKYVQENYESYKIAATGYCFGGRYSFRFASEGRGIDAAFAAHPSGLETEEVESVVKPLSLASAETDELFPAEQRREVEDLLLATQEPYQTSLYSGTFHGFGTRANISDPEQKFAKETAFYQAVIWFNSWA